MIFSIYDIDPFNFYSPYQLNKGTCFLGLVRTEHNEGRLAPLISIIPYKWKPHHLLVMGVGAVARVLLWFFSMEKIIKIIQNFNRNICF